MDDNPYASPKTEAQLAAVSRIARITIGGAVFVGLGVVLFSLGCLGAVSVNLDSKIPSQVRHGISVGAILLALSGVSLVVHGIFRNETTERLVVLLLVTGMLSGVLVVTGSTADF